MYRTNSLNVFGIKSVEMDFNYESYFSFHDCLIGLNDCCGIMYSSTLLVGSGLYV